MQEIRISHEELTKLVAGRLRINARQSIRGNRIFDAAFDRNQPTREETPNPLKSALLEPIASAISAGMLDGDADGELIPREQYGRILGPASATPPSGLGVADGPEMREQQRAAAESTLDTVNKLAILCISPNLSPKKDYWDWVRAALRLASERGISPANYLDLPEAEAEINRALYSRETYIAILERQVAVVSDPVFFEKKLLIPMMKAMLGPAALEMIQASDFQEEIRPMIQEFMGRLKETSKVWIAEEADRMFPPAN